MPLKIHRISPDEVNIDRRIIAKLLGYASEELPEPYPELVETELSRIGDYDDIAGGWRVIQDIEINYSAGTLVATELSFSIGTRIAGFMKGSESAAFFICSAGKKITERARKLMAEDKALESYICDVVGSLLVESAMDILAEKMKAETEKPGLKLTNRYSPGYCEWDVAEQHKLFSLFPEGFCGVRLSSGALMHPVKSVSGVIGIGKQVKYSKYLCDACNSLHCIYRNIKID